MRVAGSLSKEALPRAQKDRMDDQDDLIRKAVFEQRRSSAASARSPTRYHRCDGQAEASRHDTPKITTGC
jgi:hypothetical protein